MSLFYDEKGKLSAARVALFGTLGEALFIAPIDFFSPRLNLSAEWIAFFGGAILAFAAWAGGRAALQYLGPQIGAFTSGIGQAASRKPESSKRAVAGDVG